jgi:hypothetical protein
MPKQEDDKPIVVHPLTFEETLRRMLKTPPVNPGQRKAKPKRQKNKRKR